MINGNVIGNITRIYQYRCCINDRCIVDLIVAYLTARLYSLLMSKPGEYLLKTMSDHWGVPAFFEALELSASV